MFPYEFCEISKNTYSYRTPPGAGCKGRLGNFPQANLLVFYKNQNAIYDNDCKVDICSKWEIKNFNK